MKKRHIEILLFSFLLLSATRMQAKKPDRKMLDQTILKLDSALVQKDSIALRVSLKTLYFI